MSCQGAHLLLKLSAQNMVEKGAVCFGYTCKVFFGKPNLSPYDAPEQTPA